LAEDSRGVVGRSASRRPLVKSTPPGSFNLLRIELPKGGYVPEFRQIGESRAQRNTRSRWLWTASALATIVIALAALNWWRLQRKSAPLTIAVLPLENLNHDPTDDYFADGLTAELIRNLSIIDGLVPRSWISSFTFRGKRQDLRLADKWKLIISWKVPSCAPDAG
jgi:hypothetical protein